MPDSKPRSPRLAVYLAVLVTMALFPLGVISLMQTRSLIADADHMAHSAVQGRTLAAATQERAVLHHAVGATRALAVARTSLNLSADACSQMMRDYVADREDFVFAGFVGVDGILSCASSATGTDFSDDDYFNDLMADPRLTYEVNRNGPVTGKSVIIVTQPVYQGDALLGFLSVSTPHRISLERADPELISQGVTIALVSRQGDILAANRDLDRVSDFLPPRNVKALILTQPGQTFAGESLNGEERIFAVSPLMDDQIVVIGSWPKDVALAAGSPITASLTLITPIVMWLAGLGMALWGLHRLVIRHLEALRSALRRFALGERFDMLDLDAASHEFRYIQTAFNRMLVLVRDGEEQQERDLQEKTLLLREVHHRVKNNLQLIASIMNMQARNANTPEARRLLAQLQRRVRGLAMVHHTLNAKSKMTTVDTHTLVERLVSELAQRPPLKGHTVDVSSDVISMELGQDQSVTLSMLIAEALTNAVKYVGLPEGGRPWIRVDLQPTEDKGILRLTVANSRGTLDDEEDETELSAPGGIGQRLMKAFVSQLDATDEIVETDMLYQYSVTFPVEDVVGAEPPALKETNGRSGRQGKA